MNELLKSYDNLCAYCDQFWKAVFLKYPGQISCRAGCSICCELQSVNALESFVISRFLTAKIIKPADERCPFILDNLCGIYEARPIICRTHGLVFKTDECPQSISISCPYNFNDPEIELGPTDLLDIDKLSMNLAKLNYVFCTLIDKPEWITSHFLLKDIADDKFKKDFEKFTKAFPL